MTQKKSKVHNPSNLLLCKKIDKKCMWVFCKNSEFNLEAHHIVHKSLGGDDRIENLITLCHSCHSDVENHKLRIYSDILCKWRKTKWWRWDWAEEELFNRGFRNI